MVSNLIYMAHLLEGVRRKAVDVAVERDGSDLLPLLVVGEGADLVGRAACLAHQWHHQLLLAGELKKQV